ncbi:AraC family transcriptional regulator [Amycolatopsis xylanica]|uniref:AraC family transcriptional regulator n=1 Tax=Amycolatopsis xylanica TaxID=589385 RepID=A0A1H3G0C8_9PSEU|nr:AraC family transcriptional regulator [Amycolatopsis xylanica]SDX96088.1 AraC family transcriptional regulator [Amycolatopsis xylanica]
MTEPNGPWRSLTVRRKVDIEDMPLLELPPSEVLSIVVVVRGACRIESRGDRGWRAAPYGAGDVGITVPGRAVELRWRLLGTQPKETVHIALPMRAFRQFLGDDPGDLDRLDVLSSPDPVISSMADAVARAREAGAGELYAESAAQYLVAHLLGPREPAAESSALTARQLAVVTEYMRAHLAERITLDDLARELSLSRFHFLRQFAAATGSPPHRFLTELRVEAARRLLSSTPDPVGRIGKHTGFATASHFAATFQRHVGCSPSAYRLRYRDVARECRDLAGPEPA